MQLKEEFRLYLGDGDIWSNVLHWWFSVADEIYWNRDFNVPASWNFKPSILGPQNDPDDIATKVVQEVSDEDLKKFAAFIDRYARLLEHMGYSY